MKKIALLLILLNSSFLFAQKDVSGVVKDNTGNPLPGVNIIEKGTRNGVSTDSDGSYKIKVKEGATLVFSYVGFSKLEKAVTAAVMNVSLSEEGGQNLNEVFVTGTRTAPRSNTTSALPIDVLSSKDLTSTGQATFDKALQYKIPSFNTVQTPVNDATSLLDPYEIRNMGPSRTLILINGKRKNMSSLLYTQTSPGRGETGSDISAIPTDAIERVEILRDGASAQYGSDAIAGVMNIILKKNTNYGSATLRSGITSEGDGEMIGVSLNNGSTVGDRGFVNYTIDFSKVSLANRPGKVDGGTTNLGSDDESPSGGEYMDFVYVNPNDPDNYVNGATQASILADNAAGRQQINSFLTRSPDAGNVNGSPETAAAKFLVNGGINYTENTQLYYNAAYVYKKVNSFANYRTPYWRTLNDFPYLLNLFGDGVNASSYVGYVPTFTGDLNDYNATIGYKSVKNDWNTDVSLTTGGNKQTYTVSNSHNRSKDANGDFIYGGSTPITFRPGGTSFNHIVGNIDISKVLSDKVSIGFGSEFRTENFEIIAGDEASYVGIGADSFQGNTPENSGKFNRYNLGGYFDLAYDVTEDFLINGTVRYEDYSDFGGATVWKLSSRYKFLEDKITLRGSLSTGFRAPSLHQIYTQKSQSSFQAGGAIVVTGLINNVSSAARQNGIQKLDSEKSKNLTLGFGLKPSKDFSFTLDYYNIKVKDRVLLSNEIAFEDTFDSDKGIYVPTNQQSFFVNGMDTKTSGLDIVASYKNIVLGAGKLALNFSGNYTFVNERDGAVKDPESVKNLKGNSNIIDGKEVFVLEGQTIIDATQEALLFTSRPKFKYILGGDYEIGKFGFSLNNTVFGPTKFKNAGMSDDLRIEFLTKVVTDLGVTFSATEKLTLALNVNNLLNVLPEWNFKAENAAGTAILNDPAQVKNQSNLITFNQRYSQMTYDGYHFSQLGTMFNLSLNYKF
ncbi:TonB-dependent receptor [Flavobacterium sp. XS1P32]|uniref:TonB-dependent receptor n=1 Tax=Flavobacterium sp. XS1P32 TaxID=3401726 RepID=UPI003AB02E7A